MRIRNLVTPFLAVLLASSVLGAAEVHLTALSMPQGGTLTTIFSRTPRAPGKASMQASVSLNKGLASIKLSFEKMEPAILFGGDMSAYVLWAVGLDGTTDNLGEVFVDRKDCSGNQPFSATKKIFALMVTAEPYAAVNRPTEYVLFTSGEVQMGQVANTPFTFTNFRTGPKPAMDTIAYLQYNDDTPVALRQAEKVFEAAQKMNAGEVSPKAFQGAESALMKAKGLAKSRGNKREIAENSRIAVLQASQAIRDTTRANEAKAAAEAEAKRQAERAALEQRANAAETEAQRVSRELKEVETQKQALALEAGKLAQQTEQLAAERDAVAAQRDAISAERESLRKERDDLAGMLKGALSTVADTNETARGVIVSLPGILFDVNKATLRLPAQLTVAKLAGILMVFQNMNLSIEGYTDSTGSDALNMRLSSERARSVYDFLRGQGISEIRMKYQGFGPDNPVAPNDTEANRAKNRRVEVVLTQAKDR